MRKASEIKASFSGTESLALCQMFYFVGIGGAGMSGLAELLVSQGFTVEGSDVSPSPEVNRLRERGIIVHIGHDSDDLEAFLVRSGRTAVILSDAIDLFSSPEVMAAQKHGVGIYRRSQCLGFALQNYKIIAVTGTHGKTTTTGLLGSALAAAGLDPLVVVGARVAEFDGPLRLGKGEWAVVEACEAYDSLHDLMPTHVLLTNLELDHKDFHGSFEHLEASILRFSKSRLGGKLFYCEEDAGAALLAEKDGGDTVGYRLESLPSLNLSGRHNALNASGAFVVCRALGVSEEFALAGLSAFKGAERRLELRLKEPITLIDDYAHHPTEISASIQAVRERHSGRLIAVFQPHLYSRTADFLDAFARALSEADHVVITDIYPAREAPMPGISSSRIAENLSIPVTYVPSRHLLAREVARLARPGDVVLVMGAGTIREFADDFLAEIERPFTLGRRASKLHVAVLYGGESAEREVSLHSGRAVAEGAKKMGHRVTLMDATEMLLNSAEGIGALKGPERPDICLLAVHGTAAEDGAIQGLLELLHLPYSGSRIQASAIAMDKERTKEILAQHGMPVPRGQLVGSFAEVCGLEAPLVVKPNAQGSTVGLSFVEDQHQLEKAIKTALLYDTSVLVEEWIVGVEISVPVLAGKALPVVEIAPANGRYDFASKYLPGATEEIVPARLPEEILLLAQELALKAHDALRCEGATRTDIIVRKSGEKYEPFILEVNTLPGMTATSLLPNSAAAAGIAFPWLVQALIDDVILRTYGAE